MLKPTGNKVFVKKSEIKTTSGVFEVPPSNDSYIRCEIIAISVSESEAAAIQKAKFAMVQKQFLQTEIEPEVYIIDSFMIDAIEV